jgi:putative addiction module killer protein
MTAFQIETTPEFDAWLLGLPDPLTRVRLARRLDKAARGNLGDVRAVGEGVWEMREFFGPGWRMCFSHRGTVVVVMLGGGDKTSQARDIDRAQQMARRFMEPPR